MQTKRDDHSDGLSITRRDLLRYGVYGAAGLVLFDWFSLRASNQVFGADTDVAPRPAKGKAVIQIWMWGGPCHLDTFDPKPDAGYEVLNHPQHDARVERARVRFVRSADRADARWKRRLSLRWCSRLPQEGIRRRIRWAPPALHRPYHPAGALLRGRFPGTEI